MAALVTPEVVSRPGIYATIQASAAAQDAVLALEPLQVTLEDTQLDAGLIMPLTVDLRLAGLLPFEDQILLQGSRAVGQGVARCLACLDWCALHGILQPILP